LYKNSLALAEQVATVDKKSLLDYRGRVRNRDIMDQITRALQIQIGADETYN
jgi:mRNA-degrading endonuclease toxin of MazEF toxin-antitoxin module